MNRPVECLAPTRTLVLLAGLALLATGPAYGVDAFFVAPSGDDTAAGTREQPFATIARAQQAVREIKQVDDLKAPVVVHIAAGTYFLNKPLIFTPEDSGTADGPVTYRGQDDGVAVISGGRRLAGFRQNGKLWECTLAEVKAGRWYFNQLYVGGRRRPRARTPNAGEYFRIRSALPRGNGSHRGFIYAGGDVQPWQNLDDAVFVVCGSWYTTIHHVDRLDVNERTVWFTNRAGRPFNWYEGNLRYYVENVAEALDQPGEWYLNRHTGVLSYYPLPGEDLETAEIVAPVVRQTLVRFQGDPGKDRYVEHIHLKNLHFRHTDAHLPRDLYDARQAATVQEAGILADAARHCVVEDCEVANMGEHGIWFRNDCHHNLVRKCHVHDLGGGGIYIGEKWRWGNGSPGWPGYRNYEEIPHFTEHNVVDNCFIHDGCHQFAGSIGVWVGQASHTTVSHNDICDMSYSGVSVGWDWSGRKSTAHHNLIEHNRIHHLGHGRMNDMAGIYTLGVSPGTVLRNNVIHDVQAYQSPVGYCLGAGIYLDQSSAEITVEENVCYNISNAGFFLHHGANNRIRNNVFADLEGMGRIGWGMYFTAREGHADEGNVATANIVCAPKGKMAKATRHGRATSQENGGAFVQIDKNLYWSRQAAPATFSLSHADAGEGIVGFARWQQQGYDGHSTVADPRFVDRSTRDYRLQPDSPARQLGISSINTAEVGLYGDDAWTQLPELAEFRPLDMPQAFTPTRVLQLAENYEDARVGAVPDHVQFIDRAKGATIEVTDKVAAEGRQCLRLADAPGLAQAYHPNRVWRNLRLHEGAVTVSFDCMNSPDAPATFQVELRDWSEDSLKTGPRLRFQPDGTMHAGRDHRVACEPGRWYHAEIRFELGDDAPKSWQLKFGPKGEAAEPITLSFADSRFKVLTWLGLLALDRDRPAEFFIDGFRVDMR